MLDLTTQRKAIYDWAKAELEMEFIWADQDVHRPEKPYGTIKIMPGFRKLGNTDSVKWKEADTFNVAGDREFTLSLNCYGNNAMERANFVASSIEKPTVIEAFTKAGLAVVSVGQVLDLTRIMDNKFESRSQVDVIFRLRIVTEDDVGVIETAVIHNELDDSEKTITIN